MILQRVKLIKLSTSDGAYVIADPQMLGTEFWVRGNSLRMSTFTNRQSGKEGILLTVVVNEIDSPLPVELLEFTNEFQVKQ